VTRVRLPLAAGVALAVALSAPAAAQEALRVRAGEHPGYTRIVIDGPPGADYAVGIDGRRLVVSAPWATGFALDPARAARGLSRVIDFAPEGSGFAASLACDCGVRTTALADWALRPLTWQDSAPLSCRRTPRRRFGANPVPRRTL
jgi:hypothetical protein